MPVFGLPSALESSLNSLVDLRPPTSWRVSGHGRQEVTVVVRWTLHVCSPSSEKTLDYDEVDKIPPNSAPSRPVVDAAASLSQENLSALSDLNNTSIRTPNKIPGLGHQYRQQYHQQQRQQPHQNQYQHQQLNRRHSQSSSASSQENLEKSHRSLWMDPDGGDRLPMLKKHRRMNNIPYRLYRNPSYGSSRSSNTNPRSRHPSGVDSGPAFRGNITGSKDKDKDKPRSAFWATNSISNSPNLHVNSVSSGRLGSVGNNDSQCVDSNSSVFKVNSIEDSNSRDKYKAPEALASSTALCQHRLLSSFHHIEADKMATFQNSINHPCLTPRPLYAMPCDDFRSKDCGDLRSRDAAENGLLESIGPSSSHSNDQRCTNAKPVGNLNYYGNAMPSPELEVDVEDQSDANSLKQSRTELSGYKKVHTQMKTIRHIVLPGLSTPQRNPSSEGLVDRDKDLRNGIRAYLAKCGSGDSGQLELSDLVDNDNDEDEDGDVFDYNGSRRNHANEPISVQAGGKRGRDGKGDGCERLDERNGLLHATGKDRENIQDALHEPSSNSEAQTICVHSQGLNEQPNSSFQKEYISTLERQLKRRLEKHASVNSDDREVEASAEEDRNVVVIETAGNDSDGIGSPGLGYQTKEMTNENDPLPQSPLSVSIEQPEEQSTMEEVKPLKIIHLAGLHHSDDSHHGGPLEVCVGESDTSPNVRGETLAEEIVDEAVFDTEDADKRNITVSTSDSTYCQDELSDYSEHLAGDDARSFQEKSVFDEDIQETQALGSDAVDTPSAEMHDVNGSETGKNKEAEDKGEEALTDEKEIQIKIEVAEENIDTIQCELYEEEVSEKFPKIGDDDSEGPTLTGEGDEDKDGDPDTIKNATLCGKTRISTSPGDIRVSTSPGGIRVSTSPGDIRAPTSPSDIRASTSPGDIRASTSDIRASTSDIRASTSPGDVRVSTSPGDIRASTSPGDIRVSMATEEEPPQPKPSPKSSNVSRYVGPGCSTDAKCSLDEDIAHPLREETNKMGSNSDNKYLVDLSSCEERRIEIHGEVNQNEAQEKHSTEEIIDDSLIIDSDDDVCSVKLKTSGTITLSEVQEGDIAADVIDDSLVIGSDDDDCSVKLTKPMVGTSGTITQRELQEGEIAEDVIDDNLVIDSDDDDCSVKLLESTSTGFDVSDSLTQSGPKSTVFDVSDPQTQCDLKSAGFVSDSQTQNSLRSTEFDVRDSQTQSHLKSTEFDVRDSQTQSGLKRTRFDVSESQILSDTHSRSDDVDPDAVYLDKSHNKSNGECKAHNQTLTTYENEAMKACPHRNRKRKHNHHCRAGESPKRSPHYTPKETYTSSEAELTHEPPFVCSIESTDHSAHRKTKALKRKDCVRTPPSDSPSKSVSRAARKKAKALRKSHEMASHRSPHRDAHAHLPHDQDVLEKDTSNDSHHQSPSDSYPHSKTDYCDDSDSARHFQRDRSYQSPSVSSITQSPQEISVTRIRERVRQSPRRSPAKIIVRRGSSEDSSPSPSRHTLNTRLAERGRGSDTVVSSRLSERGVGPEKSLSTRQSDKSIGSEQGKYSLRVISQSPQVALVRIDHKMHSSPKRRHRQTSHDSNCPVSRSKARKDQKHRRKSPKQERPQASHDQIDVETDMLPLQPADCSTTQPLHSSPQYVTTQSLKEEADNTSRLQRHPSPPPRPSHHKATLRSEPDKPLWISTSSDSTPRHSPPPQRRHVSPDSKSQNTSYKALDLESPNSPSHAQASVDRHALGEDHESSDSVRQDTFDRSSVASESPPRPMTDSPLGFACESFEHLPEGNDVRLDDSSSDEASIRPPTPLPDD